MTIMNKSVCFFFIFVFFYCRAYLVIIGAAKFTKFGKIYVKLHVAKN